jgi:predicted aspartyl protease
MALGPIVDVKITISTITGNTINKDKKKTQILFQAVAMIDTGAARTVIREDIIKNLNLNPVGAVLINTPSSTDVQCYEYLIKLLLPQNVAIEAVVIAAPLLGQHIQCLLGRDILKNGIFIYTGYNNSFTLSF